MTQVGEVFRAPAAVRLGGMVRVNVPNIASTPVTTLAWDQGAELAKSLRFVREVVIDWDKLPPALTGNYCLVFERSA